jgi:RND family efflux transporter MFP subunit
MRPWIPLTVQLICVALYGCQKSAVSPAITPPPPPEVQFAFPTREEVINSEDYPGRLDAAETVEIRSRVTGYLDRVHFSDGDLVKQGDLLFEIDARSYQSEVDRTAAALGQAKTRLERMRNTEERTLQLVAKQATSPEQADTARFDREEAEFAVTAASADHDLAVLNLSYTKIQAGISGRISRRLVDPGNLVKADDTALATIVSVDPIYAWFAIDERTLLGLQRMIEQGTLKFSRESPLDVQLTLADEENYSRVGKVTFLDNHVDPHTGTMAARATIQNTDGFLSPGLFVRMRTPIGLPRSALLIPEQALGSDQGQRFVYVVDEQNKATYRRVTVEGRAIHGRRIISEGLQPEDRVIVSGLQRVRPGQEVKPVPAADTNVTSASPTSSAPGSTPPATSSSASIPPATSSTTSPATIPPTSSAPERSSTGPSPDKKTVTP